MSQENTKDMRFDATNNYRIQVALISCVTAIIIAGILHKQVGASIYGIPFIVAIVTYFLYPVYIVKSNTLVFRYGISKWTFNFDQGPFKVVRLTGIKSFMQSMRLESYCIRVTGAKNRNISIAIHDHELAELLRLLRDRGAVIEGDLAELKL